ncbi:MAG: TerB family tellurite resistance protein [Desulfobacterales bacterium]|nr:TerB family tellurite resistance protein [Desulfobacterales bacterium]
MASKFSEDKDHAVMLVRASILIAKADSTLSKREEEVIGKICRVLNLNTSEAICINPSA